MVLASKSSQTTLFRLGALGVSAIWAGVVVTSVFSPDMVTGSEQNHTPIAAILTWAWGILASRTLITTLADAGRRPGRAGEVRVLVTGIALLWAAATIMAVYGPVVVTGSDPTKIPVAAILAPIAAMVMGNSACQLFGSLAKK